jgi:hypothetical protein
LTSGSNRGWLRGIWRKDLDEVVVEEKRTAITTQNQSWILPVKSVRDNISTPFNSHLVPNVSIGLSFFMVDSV